MNIYLVERTDVRFREGWDEYISGVVSAANENQAIEVAKRELSGKHINSPETWNNADVTKLGVYEGQDAKVLHDHFKNG